MINKYLLIATIFCIPFLSGKSLSQSGTIYGPSSGTPIGFYENGSILGRNNELIGRIRSDGSIYEASSSTPIGWVDENGSVMGRNGMTIGRIRSDGSIYEASSSTPIGWVDENGSVMGRNSIPIAQVPDPRIGALMLLHVINLQ